MKESIRLKLVKGLNEASGVNQLDFSTNNMNMQVNDKEIEMVRQLGWEDIKLSDGPTSNNNTRFKLNVNLPFKNNFQDDIALYIDLKMGLLYQLDISIPSMLQGLGLGPKLYKAVVMDFGHIYSAKARVHNSNVYKVLDKLKHDSDIECADGKGATLCSYKGNPDKGKLFDIVKTL